MPTPATPSRSAGCGPSRANPHRSHRSGRDVDLHFYSVDVKGHPIDAPHNDMIRYDGEGKPYVRRGATYDDPRDILKRLGI